jgi:hypothetical protein
MDISFEGKFGWLVVELDPQDLAVKVKKLCEESNHSEYLNKNVRGILYRLKQNSNKKTRAFIPILTILAWIFMVGLVVLGGIKLIEIIISFI